MCKIVRLADFTTFRLGGESKIFTLNDIKFMSEVNDASLILGCGANLLVSDRGVEKTVINKLLGVSDQADGFIAYSGEKLTVLCLRAKKRCLGGLEWACSIPATLGGAIATNAGAFGGEIGRIVEWVEVYRHGKIIRLSAKDCGFSYRNSQVDGFVVRAKIKLYSQDGRLIAKKESEYRKYRNETQPRGYSAGSVFKKADLPAGYYIERAGLKGKRVGGAVVSDKHANFIINDGTATASQVYELIRFIEEMVEREFGVKLEREIKLYGEF